MSITASNDLNEETLDALNKQVNFVWKLELLAFSLLVHGILNERIKVTEVLVIVELFSAVLYR